MQRGLPQGDPIYHPLCDTQIGRCNTGDVGSSKNSHDLMTINHKLGGGKGRVLEFFFFFIGRETQKIDVLRFLWKVWEREAEAVLEEDE